MGMFAQNDAIIRRRWIDGLTVGRVAVQPTGAAVAWAVAKAGVPSYPIIQAGVEAMALSLAVY